MAMDYNLINQIFINHNKFYLSKNWVRVLITFVRFFFLRKSLGYTPSKVSGFNYFFFDFDNRSDHLNLVKSYVSKYNLGFSSFSGNHKYIVKSNLFVSWFYFFNISIFLIRNHRNNASLINILAFSAIYSSYYSLGAELGKRLHVNGCLSLNFLLVPGFCSGIKTTNDALIISIQHGLLANPVQGVNDWHDYHSDLYLCWNSSFVNAIKDRLLPHAKVLVEGRPLKLSKADRLPHQVGQREKGGKVVFLSSVSPTSGLQSINNEIKYINYLIKMSVIWDAAFVVRLHPSVKTNSFNPFVNHINLHFFVYSHEQSLIDTLSMASLVTTCNSTAILTALEFGIDCCVFPYIAQNVLSEYFPVFYESNFKSLNDFKIEFCLQEGIEKFYGKYTGNLLGVLTSEKSDINNGS
jgi:hypothetical protein